MLLLASKGFVPQDKNMLCGVVRDIKEGLKYCREALEAASVRREFYQ